MTVHLFFVRQVCCGIVCVSCLVSSVDCLISPHCCCCMRPGCFLYLRHSSTQQFTNTNTCLLTPFIYLQCRLKGRDVLTSNHCWLLSGFLNRGQREVCLEDKSFLNTVNTGTLIAFNQMFLDGKKCRLQSSIARYDNPCRAYFFLREQFIYFYGNASDKLSLKSL